ncbi:translation initiation factor, aIF-2BII family [Methanohalobium evestigatum Z-7303]|uniref:Ribose 1,5-bisphosphate isomerase n=1 Tax=Methanohalobium evestigatum (strain ATCC BAA-1072 / DSM 3721 / NBRC 107634 / OCM 161 / Z-7303) TaxID=644295 RepID=D7EBT9_METEZ|nr:ribose 1,5-bisphosphate isomerase [Methanohalobium evestigatum]ADI75061.1 translation initiation factor, aIF-2BII family [Methanohalobium evestigatum Z-7303]
MNQLQDTAEKIRTMEIRGAGRIASAAATAIHDYVKNLDAETIQEFDDKVQKAAKILVNTRPTAVSLPNAVWMSVKHSKTNVDDAREEIINNANRFIKQADYALENIGKIGSKRIQDGDVIMTHCNSHAALSAITTAFEQGKNISVITTESRPRKQGLLNIKHLNDYNIPTTYIVDSAVRSCMKNVDKVIVGADAISVNGALINKIGTSQLALAAHESRVNLLVAAETYKFSPSTIQGEMIEIEDRPTDEVINPDELRDLPYVEVKNPAFDVTPAEYIDLIITDAGVIPPSMAYFIIKEYLGWELGDID